MRVLIVKTSSMGDLIHFFPALTDAGQFFPEIEFDWVVEESFAAIPSWHPLVKRVIPVSLRRMRKNGLLKLDQARRQEWKTMFADLRAQSYDYVVDAQGLVKSAFLSFLARGKRVGLDWSSARESLASLFYQKKCRVNFQQHAITRGRQLLSLALDYPLPATAPDAGLKNTAAGNGPLVFVPGTTWASKAWPEVYWIELAHLLAAKGFKIKVSGGTEAELAYAARLAAACPAVEALPRLSLGEMSNILANAQGVIAVDTGLAHLAAALGVPTVSLYGATNPAFTGAIGKRAIQLAATFPCSPCLKRNCTYRDNAPITPACYRSLTPEKVAAALLEIN